MKTAQRFRCSCGATKLLPESPTDGPVTVRAGCPECGRITRQEAVGRVGGFL